MKKYANQRKVDWSKVDITSLPRKRCREVWDAYAYHSILPMLLPPRIVAELDAIGETTNEIPKIIGKKGRYIYGSKGTGKTILAARMYVEWYYEHIWLPASNEKKCHFCTMSDLLQQLKNCFDDKEIKTADVLDYYRTLDFLVIDDFGVDKIGDWAYQSLYYILNHRYEFLLPTVYTSNFSLSEMNAQLGDERLGRRIEENCYINKKKKTW